MPEWLATVSDRILQPIQLTGTDGGRVVRLKNLSGFVTFFLFPAGNFRFDYF